LPAAANPARNACVREAARQGYLSAIEIGRTTRPNRIYVDLRANDRYSNRLALVTCEYTSNRGVEAIYPTQGTNRPPTGSNATILTDFRTQNYTARVYIQRSTSKTMMEMTNRRTGVRFVQGTADVRRFGNGYTYSIGANRVFKGNDGTRWLQVGNRREYPVRY
jgi:hypothetical protein